MVKRPSQRPSDVASFGELKDAAMSIITTCVEGRGLGGSHLIGANNEIRIAVNTLDSKFEQIQRAMFDGQKGSFLDAATDSTSNEAIWSLDPGLQSSGSKTSSSSQSTKKQNCAAEACKKTTDCCLGFECEISAVSTMGFYNVFFGVSGTAGGAGFGWCSLVQEL
ncbi:MAG: hypothetical protein M1827_000644 [Pycnora praestabilis]|nr:MAG: hypothetical protein M1827_000644 [Pycnora praestabilis]